MCLWLCWGVDVPQTGGVFFVVAFLSLLSFGDVRCKCEPRRK